MPRRLAVLLSAVAVAALVAGLVPGLVPAAGAVSSDPSPRFSAGEAGAVYSSPALADIDGDGSNEIIFGARNGHVYAYNGDGSVVPGFPAPAVVSGSPTAVESSPAVGDVTGDGVPEIVVGAGSLNVQNQHGGIVVLNANGSRRCAKPSGDKFNQWTGGGPDGYADGVFNSPALGDVTGDGVNDIVYGAWDHQIYVANGACGELGRFDNTDTVWSAPALADVDRDGKAEIFIGGDATASPVGLPHGGGYYRSLSWSGGLHQRWVRAEAETFQGGSSVADVNGDGRLEVVTGTGQDYCLTRRKPCSHARYVWAFHLDDGSTVPGWPQALPGVSFLSTPAVGDVNGDGSLDVVIGTKGPNAEPSLGYVVALRGTGGTLWSVATGDEVISSPVIADVDPASGNEVVVGWGNGMRVLRGHDGAQLALLQAKAGGTVHKNAAAVGEVGGTRAVVAVGFDPGPSGTSLATWVGRFPAPGSGLAWPQFQKHASRTGADPVAPLRCDPGKGYWLAAADGGVFSFTAPFHGSAGGGPLNSPIVGMAAKADQSGYWFAAADGGVFNYGSAGFHGSAGNVPLNQPIVAMAARPQGDGYWLVARDGGIFNYGAAGFHGSTGAIRLNQPIVGMAATPTGRGYWLVAADGGIFNFGDAAFLGSMGGTPLNRPIVGMAAAGPGRGYWLVASDGGIFAFDAPFHGSTGALRLNQPIVAMAATASGQGYRFVARDGGIFSFGDAQFCGSMGGRPLNSPIVALAG